MIVVSPDVRVYLACGVTDIEKLCGVYHYAEYVAAVLKLPRHPGGGTRHNYWFACPARSMASSLSGGRKRPGLSVGETIAASASSFSVGSARK